MSIPHPYDCLARRLATDPKHWDRMFESAQRWHKAREISWNAVKDENITPLLGMYKSHRGGI